MSDVHSQILMTKKQLSILAIGILAISLAIVSSNGAFATSVTNYKMTDDTYVKTTFKFRPQTEVIYFPVFQMTSSYIGNDSTSFRLQGTVGDYPYLHEAMDESYKYRFAGPVVDYELKEFDVDVDIVKNGQSLKQFKYTECRVSAASIDTLFDNAEGYTTPKKTGFAMIDVIDFSCSGVTQNVSIVPEQDSGSFHDYGKQNRIMAEDVHSYVTYHFNDGSEKIDYTSFKMGGGFTETSPTRPGFVAEDIVVPHTLVDEHVEKAKIASGVSSSFNDDFAITVDFANSAVFRTLEYEDCRFDDYKVDTLYDKEEGYTAKSGFAVVDQVTVSCAGLKTKNYPLNSPRNDTISSNPYNMGGRTYAIATIIESSGNEEKINFPVYKVTTTIDTQTTINKKAQKRGATYDDVFRLNPSFQLQGVASNTPVLYELSDSIRSRGKISGTDFQGLFSAKIDIVHDGDIVKTFRYDNCRVTSYDTDTSYNAEEGYVGANGFALINYFDIECRGYEPATPTYDLLNIPEKAQTESSLERRDTTQWNPNFKYTGKY